MDKNCDITLSVVMPAYNEGAHITENLLETSKVLSGFVKRYEIIAVNDGSIDNTEEGIINASKKDDHIKSVSYMPNGGKGHAICVGIEKAQGKYIAFLDSDLEISPKLLKNFLYLMKKTNADIVIGSKMHPQTKMQYPIKRRLMSFGYYLLLKLMFRLDLHDTQSGIKMYKKEIIKPIASGLKTEGYAFDIEILVKANIEGYKIVEAPIEVVFGRSESNDGRRIGVRDAVKVFKDTVNVKRILKDYKKTCK